MLSYRHAYHAGNHADILKHLVLQQTLRYLVQKPKPILYLETHAGAGLYSLEDAISAKTGEFSGGAGRLWTADKLPEPLLELRRVIGSFQPSEALTCYPGSPCIANHWLREIDRVLLNELHPKDFALLKENLPGLRDHHLLNADGWKSLSSHLPPPERRGCVLIDPSYELKSDYVRVGEELRSALRRFASGIYLVWYPCLVGQPQASMLKQLKQLPVDALQVELIVKRPAERGMYGSGMWVLNPPWALKRELEACMPQLTRLLAEDQGATWRCLELPARVNG